LDDSASRRLERRLEAALRRARASGATTLVSFTAPVDRAVDPTAVVCASRRAGEPWACLEQPDRDRAALAALGCAHLLEARGEGRFKDVAAQWRGGDASGGGAPGR